MQESGRRYQVLPSAVRVSEGFAFHSTAVSAPGASSSPLWKEDAAVIVLLHG